MWTEITRRKYEREGQRYASDVTRCEMGVIEPHRPAAKPLGRPREIELPFFYRTDWLSVADAAEGLSPVHDRRHDAYL
jgi:hypothetical protein